MPGSQNGQDQGIPLAPLWPDLWWQDGYLCPGNLLSPFEKMEFLKCTNMFHYQRACWETWEHTRHSKKLMEKTSISMLWHYKLPVVSIFSSIPSPCRVLQWTRGLVRNEDLFNNNIYLRSSDLLYRSFHLNSDPRWAVLTLKF